LIALRRLHRTVLRAVTAVTAAAALSAPSPADAHWSASSGRSILVERYLVCDDDGDRDPRCLGPRVTEPELLAALRLSPIVPDRNNDRVVDPARDAAVLAAYFRIDAAIVPLRSMLALPMPAGAKDTHAEMEVHELWAEAAYALAELDDRASVEAIAARVREFETEGHGTLWEDTLAALTRLSPARASTYAIDFLGRLELADLRMSMPGGSSQLVALAPILLAKDRAALPELRRLTGNDDATPGFESKVPLDDSHARCRFMAARLALGEQPLVDRVRKTFAGSYSGTMVATCDNALMSTFGGDPADVGILLRHLGRDDLGFDAGMSLVAYDRILALIAELSRREAAGETKAVARARAQLRKGLVERSGYPHVAQPGHTNFGTHFVALHHAAQAGLGDADSLAIVRAMILDDRDRSGVGDLAALRALQVGLPGAVDDAAARLALDVAFVNDERSGIFEDVRPRLVEALRRRAPDDPRWTVALVDAELDVREPAMHAVSRHAPTGTCDAVIAASTAATDRGIDDGFLVLTTIPGGCEAAFEPLARDAQQPAKIRGMALEALAILGSPVPRRVGSAASAQPDMRVHVERAEAIAKALRRPLHRATDR
jgi:hypothetical protein